VAIVPSGNRKFMKLQQAVDPVAGLGATDVDQEVVYNNEQQDQGQGSAFDFEGLQQQMDGQPQESLNENPLSGDPMDQAAEEEEPLTDLEESLEKAVLKNLAELGVPEKMFRTKDGIDPFFQWDEDLDNGTSSGFYLIPSYTESRQVSRNDAKDLAQRIGAEYNLSQKITKEGHNFRVKFQTKAEEPQNAQYGTSFDNLLKPEKASDMSRAASSSNSIITANSSNQTLDNLFKQFKGKN